MKICVLDAKTLGDDCDVSVLSKAGELSIYDTTAQEDVNERIKDADVVVLNKVKLNETNLSEAKNLKLICLTATGYDNVDVSYCKSRNIGVCNVAGYSTNSVSQITIAMAMDLMCHIGQYKAYVADGSYTKSGVANYLKPVYHEFYGKTWGIVGLGNIGRAVAKVARALGCKVVCYKRTPDSEYENLSLDELLKVSDIVSLHVPLSDATKHMINKDNLKLMKKDAILINVARGAVCDEEALCDAVKSGEIGGIGVDVYSVEPFGTDSPYNDVLNMPNVCLLPHMAWGASESRQRCVNEVLSNIVSFTNGEFKNRVDL